MIMHFWVWKFKIDILHFVTKKATRISRISYALKFIFEMPTFYTIFPVYQMIFHFRKCKLSIKSIKIWYIDQWKEYFMHTIDHYIDSTKINFVDE